MIVQGSSGLGGVPTAEAHAQVEQRHHHVVPDVAHARRPLHGSTLRELGGLELRVVAGRPQFSLGFPEGLLRHFFHLGAVYLESHRRGWIGLCGRDAGGVARVDEHASCGRARAAARPVGGNCI